MNLIPALAQLVSDEYFQQFEALQFKPNLFRAVGRTYTETWHSAFLGWLLDPSGSHQLGSFPLKRFLALVSRLDIVPEISESQIFLTPNRVAAYVAMNDFEYVKVFPSESSNYEMNLSVGRADVWIEVYSPLREMGESQITNERRIDARIIIEMKVDANLGLNQCKKYADEIIARSDEKQKAIAIFIGRSESLGETSQSTVDDPRWYCLDFQILHDDLLVPCLNHPQLHKSMKPLVEHYILNLRDPRGRNGRMAYTEEEIEFARKIWERHQSTFRALGQLLHDEEFPDIINNTSETNAEELSCKIGQKTVTSSTVPIFFESSINEMMKQGHEIPKQFICGRKRFLINETAHHRDGSDFISARSLKINNNAEVYIEVNFSRKSANELMNKLYKDVSGN